MSVLYSDEALNGTKPKDKQSAVSEAFYLPQMPSTVLWMDRWILLVFPVINQSSFFLFYT